MEYSKLNTKRLLALFRSKRKQYHTYINKIKNNLYLPENEEEMYKYETSKSNMLLKELECIKRELDKREHIQ